MNITEKAAEAAAKMQKSNPSVQPGKTAGERKRIPLTLPTQKLQVPEIPGYHLHWFRGTQARIQQAQNAGYDFVRPEEVQINNVSLGGDASKTGNTDLGDRVSVAGGDIDDKGDAVRLYLMKQPMEFHLEDKKILQDRNDSIADTLTASYKTGQVGAGREAGETKEDAGLRYVGSRTKIPEMFRRKAPK